MNLANWKKQAAVRTLPFLKRFVRKARRRLNPDLDADIHGLDDKFRYTQPSLLEKGFLFGADLALAPIDPWGAGASLAQQGNEGEFVHDLSTNLPELPAFGSTQIGWFPETDISRTSGDFITTKSNQALDFLRNQGTALATRIRTDYPVFRNRGMANIPVNTKEDEMAMRIEQGSYLPPNLTTIGENIAANEADKLAVKQGNMTAAEFFGTNYS